MRTLLILLLTSCCWGQVRVRPIEWAQPVIGSSLENWYKVDKKVYRSEQPDNEEMKVLEGFGIKQVLNLRSKHSDDDEAKGTDLILHRLKTEADDLTKNDIMEALQIIRDCNEPILVHCWHGADRTGAVIAGYRIVYHRWSVDQAIDELVNGGYGYHKVYKNIPILLREIDWEKMAGQLKKKQPIEQTN